MRCTRLIAVATLLSTYAARTALAQNGGEDGAAPEDSAAAPCAAVDSAVLDSAVQQALEAARSPRPIKPKLIVVTPLSGPSYRALEAVEWQPVDLADGVRLEVGAVHTDPVTRVRQLLLRIPPATIVPPHWHGGHETLLVIRGAVLVRDSTDRVVRLGTGGFSFQPAAAPHSLATEPTEGALLLVTSDGTWDVHLMEEPRGTSPRARPRISPNAVEVGVGGTH
jgi:anti-sigma factor ChrR (cupin superfamily)